MAHTEVWGRVGGTKLETMSKDLSLIGEKWSSQYSKIDTDCKQKSIPCFRHHLGTSVFPIPSVLPHPTFFLFIALDLK